MMLNILKYKVSFLNVCLGSHACVLLLLNILHAVVELVSPRLWRLARLYSCSIIIPSPNGLGPSTDISQRVLGAALGTETFTDLDYTRCSC